MNKVPALALLLVWTACSGDAPDIGGTTDGGPDGGAGDAPGALNCTAPAQPPNSPWRFVQPSVPTFAWLMMPSADGRSFLVVDGAANWRRLLRTNDEGKTWCQIATPVTPEGVFEQEPFMYLAGTNLASGGPSYVWRSSDGGSTWQQLPAPLPGVPRGLFRMDRDGNHLIAYLPPPPPMIAPPPPPPPALWQSLDGGGSWQPRPTTISPETPFNWHAIAPDAANPSRWIAQGDTSLLAYGIIGNVNLLESFDQGASWRPVENPGGPTHIDGHLTAGLTELVTAMDGGLWRRRSGQAWNSFGKTAPLTNAQLLGVFGDVAYAMGLTAAPSRLQFMRRNDPLGEWSMVGRGDSDASVLPLSPGRLMSFGIRGTRITDDDGQSWRGMAKFTAGQLMLAGPPGNRRLYLAHPNSLSHSDDAGQTWSEHALTNQSFADVALDSHDRQVVHAAIRQPATPEGAARSTLNRSGDGGATWTALSVKLDGMDVLQVVGVLAIATTPPALLITTEKGLLRSEDAGATWTSVLAIGPNFMRAAPSDPNVILAATGIGILVSANGGRSWSEGLGTSSAADAQFHPTNPDTLYVLSTSFGWPLSRHSLAQPETSRVLRNFPGGSSTSRQLPPNRWLAVTADSRIVLRDGEGKLWDSPDDGTTWIRPGDRGSTIIQSILVNPAAPSSVTVTAEGGLLQLP